MLTVDCRHARPLTIAISWPADCFKVYQLFFVLRAALVTFDYAVLLKTRERRDISHAHVVLATIVLILILVLQVLNSLLVMAVVRIMRKRRNQRVARDAVAGEQGSQGAADERTPLLSS